MVEKEQLIKELREKWHQLSVKSAHLNFDLMNESRPDEKDRLEKNIEEINIQRTDIERELKNLVEIPMPEKDTNTSKSKTRKKVLISYCGESKVDSRHLKRLKTYIDALKNYRIDIDYWDDTQIRSGEKRREVQKNAWEEAKVAILLVSIEFFAFKNTNDLELHRLLEDAKQDRATIFSIIVNSCSSVFPMSDLDLFQPMNPIEKPLSKMTRHQQDDIFDAVNKEIKNTFGIK